jgi:hypothetical protein
MAKERLEQHLQLALPRMPDDDSFYCSPVHAESSRHCAHGSAVVMGAADFDDLRPCQLRATVLLAAQWSVSTFRVTVSVIVGLRPKE